MSGRGVCSVDDCGNPAWAKSLCNKHYIRARKHGDPSVVRVARRGPSSTLEARFWAKVDRSGDCWTWIGYIAPDGYGRLSKGRFKQGSWVAHRVSYEIANGPIPDGLQVDHLCFNRACVNPAHLEAVTQLVNNQRALARKWGQS